MFLANPTAASIGQGLQYLFLSGAAGVADVPSRDLRIGLSQVLWREGSTIARNLALGLGKADNPEDFERVAARLADHFSRSSDLAGVLARGAAERAQTDGLFAYELSEAARVSYERLLSGGSEGSTARPSRYVRGRAPASSEDEQNLWDAMVARLNNVPGPESETF